MNDGISGYNGRVDLYRQMEHLSEKASLRPKATPRPAETRGAEAPPSLGADLSESESRMIHQYFPPSERLTLRLYGPRAETETVDPNGVGRRLDLRG